MTVREESTGLWTSPEPLTGANAAMIGRPHHYFFTYDMHPLVYYGISEVSICTLFWLTGTIGFVFSTVGPTVLEINIFRKSNNFHL